MREEEHTSTAGFTHPPTPATHPSSMSEGGRASLLNPSTNPGRLSEPCLASQSRQQMSSDRKEGFPNRVDSDKVR